MPLPLTGPLSILNIRNQFTTSPGGTDAVPHQLGEFYAGGVYVPSGTRGTNGAIPSTVGDPISISDFYGAPKTEYTMIVTNGGYFWDPPGYDVFGYSNGLTFGTSIASFGSISGESVTPIGTITGIYTTVGGAMTGLTSYTYVMGISGVFTSVQIGTDTLRTYATATAVSGGYRWDGRSFAMSSDATDSVVLTI